MWGEGLAPLAAAAAGWGITVEELKVFGGAAILNAGLTGAIMVLAGGSGLEAARCGLGCIRV